jgi:hypothetical protein
MALVKKKSKLSGVKKKLDAAKATVKGVRQKVAARRPAGPQASGINAAVDPKLKALANRAAKMLELAFQKAAAHDDRASKYPLPADTNSAEAQAYRLLKDLPLVRRRAMKKLLMEGVEASASQRQQKFGDLANVDLKSRTSVMDQVRSLPVPASVRMTAQDIARARMSGEGFFIPVVTQALLPFVPTTMLARITEIECVKPSKQLEIGKDEISVSAVLIDDLGNVTAATPFDAGKFKKGDRRPFQHGVYRFNLAGGVFPKSFAVLYSVNEDDVFGLVEKTITKLLLEVILMLLAILTLGVPVLSIALLAMAAALAVSWTVPVFQLSPPNPPDDNAVSFNSAAQVAFRGANGQPSATSIALVRDQDVSGGKYRLTTDFVLE